MRQIATLIRLIIGSVFMATAVCITCIVLVLLAPWRGLRIRACNVFGKVTGPFMMWLSGCPLTWEGTEQLQADRPVIYASNHTSIVDIFLAIWLSPMGTVGVAKKQVIYYPFFGVLYLLSGHLRLDRGDHGKALASFQELSSLVKQHKLSIYLWPEGTRSRSGRLLPIKKGIVHLAISTGLPIVPVVVAGAHEAWVKNSLTLSPVPIKVTILPPIDTSTWTVDNAEAQLDELQRAFQSALPDSQQPTAA